MSDLDERVRQRAYDIWQSEGCPDGRHQEHWLRAREEILAEAGGVSGDEVPVQVPPELVEAEKAEIARRGRGRKRASADETENAPAGSGRSKAPAAMKSKSAGQTAEPVAAEAAAANAKPRRSRKA